ncbi:endo-1,4-beta-xylanase [Rugosimonospora acidiphila]|uniref:endo-1,4-beta-xylanase n=1 Tax=Rugosimonospora acidiphila TaxID=556531 RepID=UPI0031E664F2
MDSASAVDYSLPSLWQSYQDDFTMGTFGGWSSQQALYDYRSNSLPNELKLDSQIGTSNTNSLSRQAYVAAVNQINADPTLDDAAKAAAIEQANENIVLQPTTGANQAEGILKAIEAYNAANNLPEDQKKIVRAHVLAWHGGQQPNWFFTNGFVYNAADPDWASPDTMLKRLDNYIHLMMDKYAKYSDIIVSWDVVNEAVDDYTGQIRNADDPQVSQWGRIFRRPDLDGDPDARLYAESAWVRQAFESARTWSNAAGVHWKLYYNDFQDSNKLYEPKMSQTIKMLKPIHDAGNIDGYGMQGRLAWAYPSIAQLKTQIDAGLTVANEISITESDIRSDLEPNPDYDPTQPTRRVTEADAADPAHEWPNYGSCSWEQRSAANGNTFDVCNSPVRRIPAWGTGANNDLANSPDIMRKQADFAADWMDLLLSYKGKIVIDDWDGTSDSNTFNRTDGAQLWSGLPGNPEKYSFFAVIGAPAREKLRDAIAQADALDQHAFTADSWQRVSDARAAAAALVDVRIYTIDGVNAVKNATTALTDAIGRLERPFTHTGGDPTISGPVKVGATLTAHPGDWEPQPVTLSYQWYRSGQAIDGATGSSYPLVDADEGQRISVAVTGTKPGYASVTEKSKETEAVVRLAPGPIVDTVTSALGAAGNNVATATVSAEAGDLLVAYVASDSPQAGGQTSTVSGAGLTWTLAGRANGASGDAEVWTARATTALDRAKITAKGRLKNWDESITVIGYQHASGIGAVVTASSDRGAPRATLTTTAPNSWVFASGDDWLSPVHRTVGAGQTLVNESFPKVGDTYWVQSTTAPTATAGTAVTINDTAPKKDPYNLVLVELLW